MDETLRPGLRKFVVVFFNDILVYSRSYEEHLSHLAQVFCWLADDQWCLKLSKCTFAQQSISYLGHVVSAEGISTDPAKVKAIADWPQPANVKALRSFLGLAGYYRKFVRNFGIIAKPLTELLKKDVMFIWTSIHESAFQLLKQALCSHQCSLYLISPSRFTLRRMPTGTAWVQSSLKTVTLSLTAVRHSVPATKAYRSMKRNTWQSSWR